MVSIFQVSLGSFAPRYFSISPPGLKVEDLWRPWTSKHGQLCRGFGLLGLLPSGKLT